MFLIRSHPIISTATNSSNGGKPYLQVLDMTITNAYQLYKARNPLFHNTLLEFREQLVISLVIDLVNEKYTRTLQANTRLISGLHKLSQRDQRKCVVCSTKRRPKKPVYYCVQCDQNLCAAPCYYIYHTKLMIHKRNKQINLN